MLDFSDNQWIETEKIKHLGICNDNQVRDETRVTIDEYDIITNELNNLNAQEILDLEDLEC